MTTFAIALAARWPGSARSVLVECDPSGGDAATWFSLAYSPGLVSLAAAARRRANSGLLWQHTQPLPGGLPVVAAPPGADQARAALEALAPEISSDALALGELAAAPSVVVIADCGRVDWASPVLPVVQRADVTVLISRGQADALAHVVSRLSEVRRWSRRPVLVLAEPGYPSAAVEREFGMPVIARIPEDWRGAAALTGRQGGRGPSRSALGRTAARVAARLAADPSLGPVGVPSRLGIASTGPLSNAPLLLDLASRNRTPS